MPAEGFKSRASVDPLAVDIAVDVGADGLHYPLEQPVFGPDGGAKVMVEDATGARLPVGGAQIGATNEAAAGSDISTSGINGLLKRIAQNITSIITQLAAGVKRVDSSATVSILATANLSGSADIRGYRLTGLITDANFDGTVVNFQVSVDNVNFYPLYDTAGALVQITSMAASRAFSMPAQAVDWSYVKVNCVTVQAGSTTVLTLQMKS